MPGGPQKDDKKRNAEEIRRLIEELKREKKIAEVVDGEVKLCPKCDEERPLSDWDENDYICKECRWGKEAQ